MNNGIPTFGGSEEQFKRPFDVPQK